MSSNDDNNNNSSTNWLGFSLSPHMKMEVNNNNQDNQTQSASVAVSAASVGGGAGGGVTTAAVSSASFFQSPSHLNYGLYYGVDGENVGGLYSHFPVMPLKSDGSLCLMEALGRSHPQG